MLCVLLFTSCSLDRFYKGTLALYRSAWPDHTPHLCTVTWPEKGSVTQIILDVLLELFHFYLLSIETQQGVQLFYSVASSC